MESEREREREREKDFLQNQRGADPRQEVMPLKYASITLLNLITHKHPTERSSRTFPRSAWDTACHLTCLSLPPVISA